MPKFGLNFDLIAFIQTCFFGIWVKSNYSNFEIHTKWNKITKKNIQINHSSIHSFEQFSIMYVKIGSIAYYSFHFNNYRFF